MMFRPAKDRLGSDRPLSGGDDSVVALDLWISRSLHHQHGAVPVCVPDELQMLLQAFPCAPDVHC